MPSQGSGAGQRLLRTCGNSYRIKQGAAINSKATPSVKSREVDGKRHRRAAGRSGSGGGKKALVIKRAGRLLAKF